VDRWIGGCGAPSRTTEEVEITYCKSESASGSEGLTEHQMEKQKDSQHRENVQYNIAHKSTRTIGSNAGLDNNVLVYSTLRKRGGTNSIELEAMTLLRSKEAMLYGCGHERSRAEGIEGTLAMPGIGTEAGVQQQEYRTSENWCNVQETENDSESRRGRMILFL
jgi:hypothetical protein